jgi:mRNA-degrading endonuclease RelE of RelBE toxin-antitoxin system
MPNNSPILISFTARFEKDVRRLVKRYRSINKDIQGLIQQLEGGELPGDQIPNFEKAVFKVRVKNSDIQKGKSGGYRVIYYLKTEQQIILVTLYSKSDRSDVTVAEIRDILS